MQTGPSIRACLRREVPTDHETHSHTQRRQLGESRNDCGSAPRRPKRDSRNTVTVMPKPFARERGRRECESWSNQALESQTSTHRAGRREESGAGQSSRPSTACEGAEEQRVSEHAETNTRVSTWTSEQPVEPLTKPRPHPAQVK